MSFGICSYSTNEKKHLLFLHGYLADNNSFIYQKDFFSRYFKVFAPDFRGFGNNSFMPYPFSLSDYCNEIISYMKSNSIVKPSVIAHSFGCRVAISLATTYPGLFDKLVLTGCAGLKPRFSLTRSFRKVSFKCLKPFLSERVRLKFYSSDYRALSPVMRQSFKKIVALHLDSVVKYIRNDTLLVFGNKDKDTPLYMARKLNSLIKDSRLIIIKNAGHFAFIDKPFIFNREVSEFLLS